jgi:hypothetical protein
MVVDVVAVVVAVAAIVLSGCGRGPNDLTVRSGCSGRNGCSGCSGRSGNSGRIYRRISALRHLH